MCGRPTGWDEVKGDADGIFRTAVATRRDADTSSLFVAQTALDALPRIRLSRDSPSVIWLSPLPSVLLPSIIYLGTVVNC